MIEQARKIYLKQFFENFNDGKIIIDNDDCEYLFKLISKDLIEDWYKWNVDIVKMK